MNKKEINYKSNTLKSKELLRSFNDYCLSNPELRFYQALCSWSGAKAIYMLKNSCPVSVDEAIQFWNEEQRESIDLVDTFYFTKLKA